jgi:hypothetical protein
MPERRPPVRRLAYLAGVTTSVAAFALTLNGIATTQGQVRPDGEAATAVKRWEQQVADHGRRCHHPPAPAPTTPSASQREV